MLRVLVLAVGISIASGGAVAQSVEPSDPDWELIKKESEARKAAADARAAESAAESAAAKAQFGTLADYTREGSTTVGDKAGQLESAMLSAESTRQLSALIVRDACIRAAGLCKQSPATLKVPVGTAAEIVVGADMCGDLSAAAPGTVRLYLVTEAEKLTFDTADVVQASLCGAQRKLQQAIGVSDRVGSGGQSTALALPGLLTAVNIAGNLLRSDYAVQGVAITADDLLLAKAVAAAGQGMFLLPVMIPSIYRPTALTGDNPLVQAISSIDELRSRATALATTHKENAAKLGKKGKRFAAAAKQNADVATLLEAAVKGYDEYLAKATTPSDKGASEIAEAARQSRIRADLQAGSYILSVKMNAAGGTTYSKKNFFASMIGIPFYVSGGSVGSFILIQGKTGEVVSAGTYSSAAGFEQIGTLHRNRVGQ